MYNNSIGIIGLIIIIILFIILKKHQKRKPEKYKKITGKQTILYLFCSIIFLFMFYYIIKDILEKLWDIAAPL